MSLLSILTAILPIFAFANAGISIERFSMDYFVHPVPLGIALGLFFGKQLGVFSMCWLGVKLGAARLPEGINWTQVYGISALAGIGFTMSLFIGGLAFEESGVNLLFDERLGIIIGSILSALVGYLVLRAALPKAAADQD